MDFVGRWARVFSRSSGVERTLVAAQLGLVQVCCGICCCESCVVVGSGSGCDGLRLVMCEVSLGSDSWEVARSDMLTT